MPAHPVTRWPVVRALGRQSYLALSLLVFMGVIPFTDIFPFGGRLLTYLVLTLVFITGPLAVASTRTTLFLTFGLALLVLVPGLLSAFGDSKMGYQSSLLAGMLFFSFLAFLLTRELLMDDAEVDSETLWGAVNVYLLIGLCFGFAYAALSLFEPNLFSGKFMDESSHNQLRAFIYFSFVTMTTLGFGDITPNNMGVGTLTYLEAVIGQLYVAIMIARLVGLYISRKD